MYDWKPVTFSDDTQTYYSASIEKNGSSHKIVYARQSEMGMTVAVTLTMKLIEHFRPQFMIMVGIAAGIARSDMAEQIYGDVVVADMIWNYTSGKFVNPERTDIRFGNVGFISRPAVVKTDAELLEYVRKAAFSCGSPAIETALLLRCRWFPRGCAVRPPTDTKVPRQDGKLYSPDQPFQAVRGQVR